MGKPTGVFVGTGGAEWTFDLPMSEVFRQQIAKGELKPVDDAARRYASEIVETAGMRRPNRDVEPEPEPELEVEPEPEVEVVSERPPEAGPGSGRDLWAAYAASKGVEVGEDDTRADIIAKIDA